MREAVSKIEALQRPKTQGITLDAVERSIAQATRALTDLAHDDGHICFELEADATIPSEYVLYHQFRATNPRASRRRSATTCAARRGRTAAGPSSTRGPST